MFNGNLNFSACRDDENVLIAELIHEKNILAASGTHSPELDAVLEALRAQRLSENSEKEKAAGKKSAGRLRGFFIRIKLLTPEGRAHSKLV